MWCSWTVAAPEIFLWGGIEGAKCISEGAKIQKFAKNGWFWPFFLLTGGASRGQSLRWGGKCPHAPSPPLMPLLFLDITHIGSIHTVLGSFAWGLLLLSLNPSRICLNLLYLSLVLGFNCVFSKFSIRWIDMKFSRGKVSTGAEYSAFINQSLHFEEHLFKSW